MAKTNKIPTLYSDFRRRLVNFFEKVFFSGRLQKNDNMRITKPETPIPVKDESQIPNSRFPAPEEGSLIETQNPEILNVEDLAVKGEPVNTDNRLELWKTEMERDFRQWLNELSETPSGEFTDDEPDIYSFYEELCVLRNEVKKGGRRNHDVLTRFGESLTGFQNILVDIQSRLGQADARKREEELLANKRRFLALIDVFERMGRLKERLYTPPKKKLFKNYGNWENVWNRFREGFEITHSYLENLLKNEGITKMETLGRLFDPGQMNAVAVEYTEKHLPHMVIEEISPGFLQGERVIKLAEVKISKTQGRV